MIYEKDRTYEFAIVGGKSPADDTYVLLLDGLDGSPVEMPIKKLPFQRNPQYSAETMHCFVKSIGVDGLPVLKPNISHYVYELYKDIYASGGVFECEVSSVPDNPAEEPYSIVDKNGIFFRFNEREGLLAKGQKLMCKISRLTPTYFSIMRVDQNARLQFFKPEDILSGAGIPAMAGETIFAFFKNAPEFAPAREELSAGRPSWVLSAASAVARHLPEWFLVGRLKERNRVYRAFLNYYRSMLLFLLEGSSFLNAVPSEQRRALQQQITDLVDGLDPYENTLRLINAGDEDTFVEGLLDKLQRSGYIYHPAKRFAVLMLIFRLHPDKVGNYLSRIFESIFGRDLDN